jgi:hypothetical protein
VLELGGQACTRNKQWPTPTMPSHCSAVEAYKVMLFSALAKATPHSLWQILSRYYHSMRMKSCVMCPAHLPNPQATEPHCHTHLPLSSEKMSDLARPLRPCARCCCCANMRMEGSRITPWEQQHSTADSTAQHTARYGFSTAWCCDKKLITWDV